MGATVGVLFLAIGLLVGAGFTARALFNDPDHSDTMVFGLSVSIACQLFVGILIIAAIGAMAAPK